MVQRSTDMHKYLDWHSIRWKMADLRDFIVDISLDVSVQSRAAVPYPRKR